MSPVGPESGVRAQAVWRGLIVAIGLILALVLALVVVLFVANRAAIDSLAELDCRIGALLIGAPIQRQPDQSDREFLADLRTAEALLRSLREVDCSGVSGSNIDAEDIHRGLRRLHRAEPDVAPKGLRGAAAPPGSASATAATGGGGPPSGTPPASQPGGGHQGGPPGPSDDQPPPTTTTTTTTTTTPPPPPCTVNVRGVKVCLPPLGTLLPFLAPDVRSGR